MDIYRYRCSITGISLQSGSTILLLFHCRQTGCTPITLPLRRYYSDGEPIGLTPEDVNSNLIVEFFLGKGQTDEFVTGLDNGEEENRYPIADINALIEAIGVDHYGEGWETAELNGEPIYFGLISGLVWDAIAQGATPPLEPIPTIFEGLFQSTAVAKAIYGAALERVADQILELAAVHQFVTSYLGGWYPSGEDADAYDLLDEADRQEMGNLLQVARQTFADFPLLLPVIMGMRRKLLQDEPQPLSRLPNPENIPNLEMQALIERLDQWLAIHRPDYYTHLQPGVTDNQLDEFEERFLLTLPVEFRQLFRWRNGQGRDDSRSLYLNRMLLSLEDIITAKDLLDSMIGNDFDRLGWWRREWVPFLANGGGSHLCIDLTVVNGRQCGELVAYWKADADRPIEYHNLQGWLAELVEEMEAGTLELL